MTFRGADEDYAVAEVVQFMGDVTNAELKMIHCSRTYY